MRDNKRIARREFDEYVKDNVHETKNMKRLAGAYRGLVGFPSDKTPLHVRIYEAMRQDRIYVNNAEEILAVMARMGVY